MDLATLLTRNEGKTLEFKQDASSPDGIVRSVVAFANSAGGVVLVGVADKTREVVGVADPLAAEERIASILVDSIEPRIAPEIDVLAWRDRSVLAVRVHPGSSRPYNVKRLGPHDGVYVRVGSTNRRADAAMIVELRRSSGGRSFDEEPLIDAGTEAIDVAAVRASFAGSRTIDRRALTTLRIIARADGRDVPTVGGVLLFGARRIERFPDAVIEAARFIGTGRSTFADAATFDEALPHAIEGALAFVRRNLARRYEIGGVRRAEVWEYPLEAVREIVVNASVHADYSLPGMRTRIAIFDDRLEVDSPGLLLPGLTVDDLRAGVSRIRNRVIARVLRELGIVEQWGTGIPRAIEACRLAGLPEPEIEELGSLVRVTLRAARDTAEVEPLDAAVLDALAASGGLSTSDVATAISRTPRSARTRLRTLVDAGLVVEVGSSPNDPHRKYYIAEGRARYRTR